MSDLREVTGLVLRTVDVREADRVATIYTKEEGVLSAFVPGARAFKSRKFAAASQFCYGRFMLYRRGEHTRVTDAELIESFFDLRNTLEGFALASYFCEILSDVAVTEPDVSLLRLTLNSFYAIAKNRAPLSRIKAAFEIRLAAQIGFLPDLIGCAECGNKTGDFFFNIMDGNLQCAECRKKQIEEKRDVVYDPEHSHIVAQLSAAAKDALVYCIYAPLERLFSFQIPEEDALLFSHAAEIYLLNHLERSFATLDFYKTVEKP